MIKDNNILKKIIFVAVFMLFYSCSEIIFETDISQSYVNILAPTDDSNVASGTVSFNWEAVDYADNYKIQVATPNFASAKQIVVDSNVVGTNFQWQLLPNNYQWRIRAQNSAFETDYFSKFLTVSESDDFSSSEVILISPPANYDSNESIQTLAWESVEEATEYRVRIFQPDENGMLIHEETTNNTSLNYEFSDGNFTWQVRAQNTTQNTLYFSRKLLIDTVNPGIISLQSPENGSVEYAGEIKFIWQRNDIAGSVEFDSIYIYNNINLTNLIWKERSNEKQIVKDLTEDNYYWLVKPFDEAGNRGADSAVFALEVN